jgi:replicative DNA helicase
MSKDYYDDEDPGLAPFQDQDLRVLKAITSDNRLALDFINTHDASVFLGESKQVGKAICDYIKTYKIAPTKRVLVDKYKSNNTLVGQIENLFEILPGVDFNPNEYYYDLDKIKQNYAETKFNALKDDLRFHDKEGIDGTMNKMEQMLQDIKRIRQAGKRVYTQKTLDEYLPEFHEEYVAKIENPLLGQGVLSGYSYLDYVTNGLQPAEMLIIGGETSSGKSMFLNNIAIQMWMQKNTISTDSNQYNGGCNILYFSLEMPYKACFKRTLARLADVPMYGLRDSKLTKAETESLNLASRFIKKFSERGPKFEIVDIPRGVNAAQVEERYLEARQKFDPRYPTVIFIDYLGLMEDESADGDDWLKLGKIAGKVHEFGRAYNVPIATAVQLNRPNKSKTAEPGENIGVHRIGRSSLIMHHANIGVQIETRKDEWLRDTFLYHIIKNRDGELGKHEISKRFANAAIFDVPYVAPDRDEYGGYMSGFNDEDDISDQVKKMLGL